MAYTEYTFRVEMRDGQDQRHVGADLFKESGDWVIFYRKPPQGGTVEYWRAHISSVVSIEIVKNGPNP